MSGQARYELLVFDWDGTLMDSETHIVASMQGAMAELGVPPREVQAIKDIIGLGMLEAIDRLYPGADADFHQRFRACYARRFYDDAHAPPRLFAGVRETLARLKAAGYRLAVATGKARRGLDRALADTGIDALFDASRCADEACSKPHPQMLHELMAALGGAPERTLMVGDTEHDMLMAHAAGVDPLAVAYGVHERERLLSHRPVACVETPAEIPEWLAAGDEPASSTA